MNISNLTFPAGRYNPGGITEVLQAFVEDIASFPVLADPDTATTLASLVTYAEAITMKTGKSFRKIYCTLEEGEIKSKMVGARDGKGYENTLEISFPGSEGEMLGFRAYAANRQSVFLVKEKNGKVRVLGSLEDPAYFEDDDATSGKKIADLRATKMTFKASGATAAPIYSLPVTSLLVPAA